MDERKPKKKTGNDYVAEVYGQYNAGLRFNTQINLNDTVENNENFFIGKQWEGVEANRLPTPVFNIIKRIILFQVASVVSDNVKISATPLSCLAIQQENNMLVEQFCNILNAQFDAIWERTKSAKKGREFMRDAAVRGDGVIYSYFDPDEIAGGGAEGFIRTELLENNRVYFGNPQNREVQEQPYIIIEKRMLVCDAKDLAEEYDGEPEKIQPDADENNNRFHSFTSDKVTVLTRFRRDKETGTIWCSMTTKDGMIREEWDTDQKLYPIAWMSWDYVTNCYHGMAAVTGLIPNQVFINQMFAMVYLSLMTTAYPKIVYDKTRVRRWDAAVGTAIGVNGGDVNSVAKNLDGATISPQVSEFISMTINTTKDLMGATDAAMGSTRPDNTSAIIALQKAANVPMEMVKQNFYQSIEDMANIWIDLMRVYFGKRTVEVEMPQNNGYMLPNPDSMAKMGVEFDFSMLNANPVNIKIDVGGSAYWSEIAQLQTLDNLLMNKQITAVDYIERLPSGYISKQTELTEALRQREQEQKMQQMMQSGMTPPQPQSGGQSPSGGRGSMGRPGGIAQQPEAQVKGGSGYGQLQRQLNEAATAGSGR